jgi:hypothetical protein
VRGRDRQRTVLLGGEIAGEAADVLHFAQDLAGARDHFAARRRDRGEALALARKQLHAELGFELLELLGNARLAGIQPLGSRRDVQATVDDSNQILQLFQRQTEPPGENQKAASSFRVGGLRAI